MSTAKPAKIPRLVITPATKTKSVDLSKSIVEEKGHPTVTSPQPSQDPLSTIPTLKEQDEVTAMTDDKKSKHPKGHKVRALAEVWGNMDAKSFLHLTDTLTLGDVWSQPIKCVPNRGSIATVTFRQLVNAPHIKSRDIDTKMSTDDLLQMLYLNDKLHSFMSDAQIAPFEEWLNHKTASCVRVKGVDEANDRAKLIDFIINEDPMFSFYIGKLGIFFRKICYHSYKTTVSGEEKLINPAMVKCHAVTGTFEYIIEARFLPLPDKWFEQIGVADLMDIATSK